MAEHSSGSIFIVDDDPSVRDALTVVFDLEGFTARAFSNGDDFLEAIRTETPGCVLLGTASPPGASGGPAFATDARIPGMMGTPSYGRFCGTTVTGPSRTR